MQLSHAAIEVSMCVKVTLLVGGPLPLSLMSKPSVACARAGHRCALALTTARKRRTNSWITPLLLLLKSDSEMSEPRVLRQPETQPSLVPGFGQFPSFLTISFNNINVLVFNIPVFVALNHEVNNYLKTKKHEVITVHDYTSFITGQSDVFRCLFIVFLPAP